MSAAFDDLEFSYDGRTTLRKANRPYIYTQPAQMINNRKEIRALRLEADPALALSAWQRRGSHSPNLPLEIFVTVHGPVDSSAGSALRPIDLNISGSDLQASASHARSISLGHRIMWATMVVLALVAGILTGASLSSPDYWLAPDAALLASLGSLGLAATLFKLGEGSRGRDGSA